MKQKEGTTFVFNYESIKYNQILKDRKGILWFATQYGLNVLTPDGRSHILGKEEGLSKPILNVVEDKNHDIWITTVTSVYKITVECNADGYNFHVNSYLSEVEILQGDLFSFPSLATHNSLYLGLLNGFITFSPDNMGDSRSLSRPLFTSFQAIQCSNSFR